MHKEFKWNVLKSKRLKETRGVSFEEILNQKLVRIVDHHNRSHQKVMLFEFKGQLWVVPFVENEKELFLKTLYPSRKYTKVWLKREVV